MQACFETLRSHPALDVRLFKGAGMANPGEQSLRHFTRNGGAARVLALLTGRGPYVIEQVSFTAALLPHIAREQPDVIYFCDPAIGKMLSRWRRLRGGNYRLLFHNGGPIAPPFPWYDHIQQVTPGAVDDAVAAGEPLGRQTLLPCGLNIGPAPSPPGPEERARRRRALGLPDGRPIVLSVGALNRAHKRMDYLVREVAALAEPRPFLVMVGQTESDTATVRTIATFLLGENGFAMRTVGADQVADFYRAADVFALASLKEGFGLGYVEALAHGLPCIAHDFAVSQYVLGEFGILTDLRQPGALTGAIRAILAAGSTLDEVRQRHASATARFAWPNVAPEYVNMLRGCARQPARELAVSA